MSRSERTVSTIQGRPLTKAELGRIDAWWRAANYLSVGQIYLMDNPLLREQLLPEHVKPRLLGHWGTTPGLNFVYAHLNRAISARDLDMIYIIGPGHGGPGLVASAWLEGTYTRGLPRHRSRRRRHAAAVPPVLLPRRHPQPRGAGDAGLHPRGRRARATPSRTPTVPRSTTRTSSSRPSSGDGEAETGPAGDELALQQVPRPGRDGAVLPILHLNGYKIANPTVLARISEDELTSLMRGYGHTPYVVEGADPAEMHQAFAATLDHCLDEIRDIQGEARAPRRGSRRSPRRPWPMIVLRSPKGWTGPKELDGKQVEGSWRSHQVPFADARGNDSHREVLEKWMRSYRPEELFDADGAPVPEIASLHPNGERRMSANPHANGGLLLRDLRMPDFRDYAVEVDAPGTGRRGVHPGAGHVPARRDGAQHGQLPAVLARTRTTRTGSRTSSR